MKVLALDTETFSPTPIRHGTHRYAEDAEVMLVALALNDGAVEVWDTQDLPNWREVLQAAIDDVDQVVIQNSAFDRTVLRHSGVHIPVDKIVDTMVIALQHALPAGLGDLCDVLGVPQDKAKDKDGKKLIQLFCKPTPKNWKIRRATRDTHPEEWARFLEYARLDVVAMRDVLPRLPRWNCNASERELWLLDQAINDRGFHADVEFARHAKSAFARASGALATRASALTADAVTSLTQRDKVKAYVEKDLGVVMPDMTKGTIADMLKDETLEQEARELLELRQQAAATSPAKYDTILKATSSDGRLRGTIQYCGASRTGRDAGRTFQPQNLPRPSMSAQDIEQGIDAIMLGCEDLLYENVSELCANAVRGCIVASEGQKLLVSDLSNIEGRVAAWLAGEFWKIEAFEAYDAGRGPDIYKLTAARILNKHHSEVTKLERQNQGKVPELACLPEGTLVSTARGEVPIEKVCPGDLVWDGVSWVRTDGPIFKGVKHVIEYDGLCATPNHLVWVERQADPVEFGRAAADGLRLVRAGPRNEASASASGEAVNSRETTLHQSQGQGFQELRSEGGRISLSHGGGGVCVGVGEPRSTAAGGATGPHTQRWSLRGGELALVEQESEQRPHTAQQTSRCMASVSRTVPSRKVRGYDAEEPTSDGLFVRGNRSPLVPTQLQAKRRVWDLLNCEPLRRFTASGRLVHNCSYQGSVGAFTAMGKAYGVKLPEERILEIVRAWRARHPKIRSFWYDMEDAARRAIRNPKEAYKVRGLTFDMSEAGGFPYLRMRLPSGRYLCYHKPQVGIECYKCEGSGEVLSKLSEVIVCPNCGGSGREDELIRFEGVNQYTRKWQQLETYGGKLFENAVQAIARDVFLDGTRRAEKAGYHVVLRVHDELVCEVPDTPEYTVEALNGFLTEHSSWTLGLPLAAAGHEMYRYSKAD